MARKTSAGGAPEARLAAAALKLLDAKRWDRIAFASVVRAAKVPWVDVLRVVPTRGRLASVLLHRIVAETARRYRPERHAKSALERIFDVAMSWFEAQQSRKKAMRNFYGGLAREPLAIVSLRASILGSAAALLALADADSGPGGPLRAAALAAILARAIPVWLDDDRELDRTMAQIDGDLRRIGRLL